MSMTTGVRRLTMGKRTGRCMAEMAVRDLAVKTRNKEASKIIIPERFFAPPLCPVLL